MAPAEAPWVLDTSVVAGWFFTDEPGHDRALAVRRHVGDEPHRYLVPHLFQSELAHVLARKSGRDAGFVTAALGLTLRLGIRTMAPSEPVLLRVAEWSCRG